MKNVCIQKPETFTCRDLSAGNIARRKLQFSSGHWLEHWLEHWPPPKILDYFESIMALKTVSCNLIWCPLEIFW